ncbi:hypothetical protein P3L10_002008 [Capsicum annuum]
MHNCQSEKPLHMETTCGSLLSEMQKIWDEMGEPDIERESFLNFNKSAWRYIEEK